MQDPETTPHAFITPPHRFRAILPWIAVIVLLPLSLPTFAAPSNDADKEQQAPQVDTRGGHRPHEFFGMALGVDYPVGAQNGRAVPVFYTIYYNGEKGRDDIAAWAELRSSDITARLSPRIYKSTYASIEARGATFLTNAAPYFYEEGRLDNDRSVYQSYYGIGAELGMRPARYLTASLAVDAKRYILSKYWGSSPFSAPPDHCQQSFGFRINYDDLFFYKGLKLVGGYEGYLEGMYARRDVWGPWDGDPDSWRNWRRAKEWGYLKLYAAGYFLPVFDHNLKLFLRAGALVDADRFSAVRAGSTFGEVPLSGAGYGELAMDRYLFFRSEYHLDIVPTFRILFGLDLGVFRNLEKKEAFAAGFSAGFEWKLLYGIPFCITYGYCPEMIRPGVNGGHEIFVYLKGAVY